MIQVGMRRAGFALALAALAAGCGGSSGTTSTAKARGKAKGAASEEVAPRETVGKRTDTVLLLKDALADGGQVAEAGGTVGPSGGYLGTIAKTYRRAAGEIGGLYPVNQAIQAHEILNGPLKDYAEFESLILKKGQADALTLPTLPYYQEYAYDEEGHKVVIVEFPKRREEVQQRD
jgi:hypothetical protein